MGAKKAKNTCYAYWFSPDRQGIVATWSECEALVHGRTARYRGFPAEAEARAWLDSGAAYEVAPGGHPGRTGRAAATRVAKAELPDDALYFDAGTGGGKGTESRVTDRDGTPLTFLGEATEGALTPEGNLRLPGRTNNYGELMACVLALRVALARGVRLVLGDSRLVIDWWSKGHVSKDAAQDAALMALAREARRLRTEFERRGGRVAHVSGDVNPADLGYHRCA